MTKYYSGSELSQRFVYLEHSMISVTAVQTLLISAANNYTGAAVGPDLSQAKAEQRRRDLLGKKGRW